jgi:hypothetical protein
MRFFKYSLFLLLINFSFAADQPKLFNSKDCLKSVFQIQISHKTGPFGIFRNHLAINKDQCIIEVKHKKYLEKQWLVDVCREPVHIKVNSHADVEVAKKDLACSTPTKEKQGFCFHSQEILNLVQDHALIFANGLKEDLTSDHGKAYCSFLLLKKYMQKDTIYSILAEETLSVFEGEVKEAKPVSVPASSTEEKTKPSPSVEKTPEGSF